MSMLGDIFRGILTLGTYKEKVDKLEKEMESLKKQNKTIISEINVIKKNPGAKSSSPLVLNDYGINLLQESGFNDLFPTIKESLVKRIEEMKPKGKYDVSDYAGLALVDLRNEDYEGFEPIKTYCYRNGVDFGEVLALGSLPLRDYYLEKHPEIPD